MQESTSPKRIAANRQNALRSTGPKTAEGKSVVRWNALKHGLLSREMLIPGEDEEDLLALRDELHAQLEPVGTLEILLVERMVSAIWQLRRHGKIESNAFRFQICKMFERRRYRTGGYMASLLDPPHVQRMGVTVTDPETPDEHQRRKQETEALRDSDSTVLGEAYAEDRPTASF